ncbi:hypothetical protein I7I51_06328 [Histoplasma capsulatum]|uniref:Uncharacterized protein n=1 Tax=Ajellomyces capsulatus TaxID=5037 RepID=A0A8A1MLE1_AJECA|nr:hypothetical protein I7I51_06328 [Histoplasma capsulatum]
MDLAGGFTLLLSAWSRSNKAHAEVNFLPPSFMEMISPYDRQDSERPDNVTGLDFYYYNNIGSYYNGMFSLFISPVYDPPDYPSQNTDYPCREYENRTFEIPMNAISQVSGDLPEIKSSAKSVLPLHSGMGQAF